MILLNTLSGGWKFDLSKEVSLHFSELTQSLLALNHLSIGLVSSARFLMHSLLSPFAKIEVSSAKSTLLVLLHSSGKSFM